MDNAYMDTIEHRGVVERVDVRASTVFVRLNADKECGGCPAHAMCNISGSDSGNVIAVKTPIAGAFREGDKVVACGTEALHRKAIMLATVLPCVALLAVMVGVYVLTMNQLLAVVCGLATTILFYVVLYLCRDRIAHEFRFTLRKDND